MTSWPWVSRAVLSEVVARAERSERQYDQLSGRYEALLVRYHALKMTGAQDVAPSVPPAEPKAPDPAILAATIKAQGNRRLEQHLVGMVRLRRSQGEEDAAIVHAIMEGIPDDPATVGVGE